jgi:BED zinc finger
MASFLAVPDVETDTTLSPNASPSPGLSPNESQPEGPRRQPRKRKAAETWKHSREPQGEEPEFKGKDRVIYCKYCENPSYHCQSTSSFRHHLATKHDIHVEVGISHLKKSTQEQLQALYGKAEESGSDLQQLDSQILKKVLKKSVISSGLIAMIAIENLSFRLVESPYFHAFCRTLNPELDAELPLAHSQVSLGINKSYLYLKGIVQQKLQASLSKIHLSLDIWTSPNRLLFLGVCAHFVESGTKKLAKALLELRTVPSHAAKDQLDALRVILEGYGIMENVGAMIGDNHSTNDKLARLLSKFLSVENVAVQVRF